MVLALHGAIGTTAIPKNSQLSSRQETTALSYQRHLAASNILRSCRPLQRSFRGLSGSSASRSLVARATQAAAAMTQETTKKATAEDLKALIDKVDCFIFDCDGVIWRGDTLIEGVPETIDMLRAKGKKLYFVTNNSTKSRKGYLSKFTKLGLDIAAEEIYSSSYAAAAYLEADKFPSNKKVYVIGDVGIEEELDLLGIDHIGGPSDGGKTINLKPGYALPHDDSVGAVVVGHDRNINYYKIQYATLCLRQNPGCKFIATNLDAVTHLTDAQEWAGNGAMVGAIRGSSQKAPIVVGKPEEFMLANIAEKSGLRRDQICMVGDRLDTDIQFGLDGGLTTILVLSGVTTEAELKSPDNKVQPHLFTAQLPDFRQAA